MNLVRISPVTNLQEQIGEMGATHNLWARILFQLLHKVPFVICQFVVFVVLSITFSLKLNSEFL